MNPEDDTKEHAEVATVELCEAPAGEGETLIELLLTEQSARAAEVPPAREEASAPELEAAPARIDGVMIGRLVAFVGALRVTFPGAPEGGVVARALASLGAEDVGSDVALMFEAGDPARPLVMGKMHPSAGLARDLSVKADDERVELTAEKEIVLRCGDSSITLTRAGKILIRGAYVLSRSSGVNRIQGGSVEIN